MHPRCAVKNDVDTVKAALGSAADLDLTDAVSFDGRCYTSAAFFSADTAQVFGKSWVPLVHVSSVERRGDFVNIDVAGETVVVIRGKDGEVRVLSRVCRHRGMDMSPPGYRSRGGRRDPRSRGADDPERD